MEALSRLTFLLLLSFSFSSPQTVIPSILLFPWRWLPIFQWKPGRRWWLKQLTMCAAVKLLLFLVEIFGPLPLSVSVLDTLASSDGAPGCATIRSRGFEYRLPKCEPHKRQTMTLCNILWILRFISGSDTERLCMTWMRSGKYDLELPPVTQTQIKY